MEDSTKSVKIPTAPKLLKKEARKNYRMLYQILIDEERGHEKYRMSVAVAANALFLYEISILAVDIHKDSTVKEIGEGIRAMNSASMEWARSAKMLLLTPESELKMKEAPVEDEEVVKPPTMAEVVGELLKTKSKNENYGHRTPQNKSTVEARTKAKKNKK